MPNFSLITQEWSLKEKRYVDREEATLEAMHNITEGSDLTSAEESAILEESADGG